MPTATEIADAFAAAQAPLIRLRAAAQAAGQRGAAGVAQAAIDDLERYARQARASDLLTRWTAERAVDTLAEVAIEARLDRPGAATVDLESGGRLDVIPAAAREPEPGYIVEHRSARGDEVVACYRAADNPKLVALVELLTGATASPAAA